MSQLTPRQAAVLTFVAKNGESVVSTRFAASLVNRGLLEKIGQFNHRGAKTYRLTDAGRIAASTLEVTA
jgi:DNA-binding MarR family transcriptional regulator